MANQISLHPLPSRNPSPSTAKTHHVGNPPTSFTNPWPSVGSKPGLGKVFNMRFGSHPEKNFVPVPQGPNGTRSEELVKVVPPTWGEDQPSKLRATWIGHASILAELPVQKDASRGVRILFDPVFSERTSPMTFIGPKRYTPTPCAIGEVPEVDLICISHNHYDHLDFYAVDALYKQQAGRVHFMVPLGVKSWVLQHVRCRESEVTECDWWDASAVTVAGVGEMELICTPTQHISARTPFDQGHTLWCSWAVCDPASGKRLWFSGDTAYQAVDTPSPCPAFKQIGEALGPFDLAFVPIGLYSPPSFMGGVHATPEQSLEIHKDVRSRLSIGMHYGTVRGGLSEQYEDVRDPPRRWRECAEKEGVWRGGGIEGDGGMVDTSKEGVGICHVGETVAV